VSVLGDCFGDFRASAWRLETLPAYLVQEEAEQIRAWHDGRPRPERSVRNDDYLREIAANVLAGRDRRRIRLADHPLSEYVRWELAAYAENAVVGEEIRVTVRREGGTVLVPVLDQVALDFWWFDAGTEDERAVLLDYDHEGRFTGEHLASAVDLAWCRRLWAAAERHSAPLNEYVARYADDELRKLTEGDA
jgi:hypothetical protein